MAEPTPILEFQFNSPECSSSPDTIYQWRDASDSASLATAEYTPDFCGYATTGIKVDANSCCRASLDLSLSEGYGSVATSLDLLKFPETAKDQQYCLMENSTAIFGYEKAYFAANGACFGEFRCFSSNKSLLVYPEQGCSGQATVLSLGVSPTPMGKLPMVLASFVSIAPAGATIEYTWTTYFPSVYYVQSPDYLIDTVSRIFNISAMILPLIFVFWHLRQYIARKHLTTLLFCFAHLVLLAAACIMMAILNLRFDLNEDISLTCKLLSAGYYTSAIPYLLAMIMNTMAVFEIIFRDLKTRYKVGVYVILVLLHLALNGPTYLWPSICMADQLSSFQISILHWQNAVTGVQTLVMYCYDVLCVNAISIYLYSMDKRLKNSENKNMEAVKQTFLDRGCFFTLVAQTTVLFMKVIVLALYKYKSWPGSDKNYDSVTMFSLLLLAMHCALSSYSYIHYASVLRKALHRKKDPKPKTKSMTRIKSGFLGVFKMAKTTDKSSKTFLNGSKDNLNSPAIKNATDDNLIPSSQVRPRSPAQDSMNNLPSDPKSTNGTGESNSKPKSVEMEDLETIKIPRKAP